MNVRRRSISQPATFFGSVDRTSTTTATGVGLSGVLQDDRTARLAGGVKGKIAPLP